MPNYTRDKRSPVPKNSAVSKAMSANKSKNTKPELLLRKALWAAGTKGYRLHRKDVPGRADIAFVSKRLAVFINGCFWHRCPHCDLKMPKSNVEFWREKFSKNVARDKNKTAQLKEMGWRVLTIWECELKEDMAAAVKKIQDELAANLDRARPNVIFAKSQKNERDQSN